MAQHTPDRQERAAGLSLCAGSFLPHVLQTPSWAGAGGGTCRTSSPAPAVGKGTGKGTSGHPGPFTVLNLKKVLG